MAKIAIVSRANQPRISRGDDPPYPPRSSRGGRSQKTRSATALRQGRCGVTHRPAALAGCGGAVAPPGLFMGQASLRSSVGRGGADKKAIFALRPPPPHNRGDGGAPPPGKDVTVFPTSPGFPLALGG